MPRTNQLVTFDDALSQRPPAMQANVVHRGDRPIHIGNADDLIATGKLAGFAFSRKFRLRGELDQHLALGTWHLVCESYAIPKKLNYFPVWLSANCQTLTADFLLRLQRLRDHDLPLEILHHVLIQAHLSRLLRQRHLIDFVLQL